MRQRERGERGAGGALSPLLAHGQYGAANSSSPLGGGLNSGNREKGRQKEAAKSLLTRNPLLSRLRRARMGGCLASKPSYSVAKGEEARMRQMEEEVERERLRRREGETTTTTRTTFLPLICHISYWLLSATLNEGKQLLQYYMRESQNGRLGCKTLFIAADCSPSTVILRQKSAARQSATGADIRRSYRRSALVKRPLLDGPAGEPVWNLPLYDLSSFEETPKE